MRLLRRDLAFLLAVAMLFLPKAVSAQELSWPQEITSEEGTLVIYQPQPERLEGNKLHARSAISIELKDAESPIFGAMWFESRIETDQDAGTASIIDIEVSKAGWPDSRDAGEQRLMRVVESAFPVHGLELSLERLSASLETANIERESLENLNNEPPEIVFRETLSVLLVFDGEPRFEKVEDSPYERAVNTPFLVARERRGRLYLSNGAFWYEADEPLGPWKLTDSAPEDLQRMVAQAMTNSGAAGPSPEKAPAVVVATKPTELVSSDGEPDWQSLAGGEILYVKNTETPWLRHLPTGNIYLLLSGRWFRSKTEEGQWTFVPATELPVAFEKIPPASDIGGLRSSVAGTEEAEQAMLDAAIPQTAAIKRAETSLSVDYDGEPRFEAIKGTSVSYAVNTASQVLQIDKVFYAVDNGVWFKSLSAQGPRIVADDVPKDEIARIPADSPVYNVTHVQVYESTPEVVYVGYTPGYLWSFPYYGVPVYGTGWYYPPYWGGFYYPRPPTWGFHVGYNPWTGWNFGVSWSNGFFSVGVSWGGGWGCCGGGWYGGGYRGPTIINTGDINIGNTVNIGNRTEIGNRIGDNSRNIGDRQRNVYRNAENRDRLASRDQRDQLRKARPSTQRANNVFADRNGNVARRVDGGWEQRNNGQWSRDFQGGAGTPSQRNSNTGSLNRPQTRDFANTRPTTGFDRSGFDRAHRARSTGASREMRRPARMRRR
ncbi:MAG: carbohydrate-binding family V/XII [Pseudomonadota bacterium]